VITLRRTVRLAIDPTNACGPSPDTRTDANGFGGRPSIDAWGAYFEIELACRGEADPQTGYLINIKDIDEAVRRTALPILRSAAAERRHPVAVLPHLLRAAEAAVPRPVLSLTLRITPTHAIHTETHMPGRAILTQRFEFAAAHRLHSPTLSDEENRLVFGKCNNPAGHGHNYVIEPRVEIGVRDDGGSMSLRELEAIVSRSLIEPFDHKHLNVDTAEFRDGSGLNPTVENIARVFYRLLAPEIARAGSDARLTSIKVWETDRTSAEYGEPA